MCLLKIGVHGGSLSLPFGKASTPKEVFKIVSNAKIDCLTIPVMSPTWKINHETITAHELEARALQVAK